MIFANEYQGEGTNHGHGFVSLANVYQHSSLQDVASMLESNVRNMSTDDILQRVKSFCNHVQRESRFDLAQHAQTPALKNSSRISIFQSYKSDRHTCGVIGWSPSDT